MRDRARSPGRRYGTWIVVLLAALVTTACSRPRTPTATPSAGMATADCSGWEAAPVARGPVPHAIEPGSPITLGIVRARVLERANLHVAAETYRVAEARGRVRQAALSPNPYLMIKRRRLDDLDLLDSGMVEVEVGQPIELGGKRAARIAAARAEMRRVSEDVRALVLLTLRQAESQFFKILRLDRELTVAREEAKATRDLVALAESRFKSGKDSRVPVLRFEAAAESADLAVQDLAGRHGQACRVLDELLGLPVGTTLSVHGDWSVTELTTLDREEAARSLARHPRRTAAEGAVRAADRAIRRADANAWPDLTVSLRGEHDYDGEQSYVGFGVYIPIPLWNKNEGTRVEARAAARRARRVVDAETLKLASDLEEAFLAYDTAGQNVQGFSERILPRLETSLELARSAYENGRSSYLDVLDSLLAWIRSRRDRIGHLEMRAQAAVRIRYLTGTD